ncbi:MAG: hypothetical protein ACOYOS_12365 [Syntrophales bacterium]
MAMYRIKEGSSKTTKLEDFEFVSEGGHDFSPQRILAANPNIIFDLPELELVNTDVFISLPEYSTSRGSIDLLVIGSNAEIIIVETKLLRNPESTRQVVAQIIDYIKAFSEETLDDLTRKINGKLPREAKRLINDLNFATLLKDNIRTGNFKVIVVGDYIHPNVLGMIESIHSAPHLSFTIYLIDLHTCRLGPDEIIIKPGIVASTVEIERSVIRIVIEPSSAKYHIDTQTPEPKGKGTKPILTWEQYISNVTKPSFRRMIEDFRNRWITEIDDSINMGQVGFSAGIEYGGKRLPLQYIYDTKISIISENTSRNTNVPKHLYDDYIADLKRSGLLYDKYIASGKVDVDYTLINDETLSLILNAAMKLANRYKSTAD